MQIVVCEFFFMFLPCLITFVFVVWCLNALPRFCCLLWTGLRISVGLCRCGDLTLSWTSLIYRVSHVIFIAR